MTGLFAATVRRLLQSSLLLCVAAYALPVVIDPSDNDPAVIEHRKQQANFIAGEHHLRQDYAFRTSLSPVAQHADEIVAAIRQYEIDTFWRKPAPLGDEQDERYAGMMFAKAKPLIPDTMLWDIVSRMPKGALLHAHPTALLEFQTILDILLETEGIVIAASQDVSTELAKENATIAFAHVNNVTALGLQANVSIHSPDYIPKTRVPVTVAADTYPGGRPAFIDFLMTKVSITPDEAVRHEYGVDEVWRKFQSCFDPAGSMLTYEPVVRQYYQRLFNSFVDDGINWAEFRSGGSSAKLVHEGQEVPDPDPEFQFRVLLDELNKFQNTEKGRDFWGLRIIWSDYRGLSRPRLLSNMKQALIRKQRFPDLFSGYDVVAQEDLGRSLSDLAPELLWFTSQAEALNLTYPFFFHAGETLGDGNSTDDNLFDAIMFNSRRMGHGFSLYKHPLLLERVKADNVLIEVSPISNEVLRLNTDILHHPLPALIAHGIPVAISNDDPAILGQDSAGLSYDFYQVIQGFDNIGLAGLGALAQNSIRWSNFVDQNQDEWIRDIELGASGTGIKASRLVEWEGKWEAYCQWIVDTYTEWNATLS
ncbi:hypothetical protein F4778DRAFT_793820 [Xylariomycetidae sp. FL2044]|nr:hypothetical protein F4778DRAFT_793820 [Xylariomycetidae sp. FL2044]